jgi:hypothetical protein
MHQKIKEKVSQKSIKSGGIVVSTKNDPDPINELICSKCLLFTNCSAACEHLDEVYSRIGYEFYDKEYIYQPKLMRSKGKRDEIYQIVKNIVNEYLKEKEICYGGETDT